MGYLPFESNELSTYSQMALAKGLNFQKTNREFFRQGLQLSLERIVMYRGGWMTKKVLAAAQNPLLLAVDVEFTA